MSVRKVFMMLSVAMTINLCASSEKILRVENKFSFPALFCESMARLVVMHNDAEKRPSKVHPWLMESITSCVNGEPFLVDDFPDIVANEMLEAEGRISEAIDWKKSDEAYRDLLIRFGTHRACCGHGELDAIVRYVNERYEKWLTWYNRYAEPCV